MRSAASEPSGIASPVASGISRSRLRLGTYAVLIVAEVPFRESAPARARTRDITVTLGDGVIVKEEIEGAMGIVHGRDRVRGFGDSYEGTSRQPSIYSFGFLS